MRFILNFFFFGFIFFLIYVYFPDAFHTLASWAQSFFNLLKDFLTSLGDKIHYAPPPAP